MSLRTSWGPKVVGIDSALEQARQNSTLSRIWKKDATLWSRNQTVMDEIVSRLGWLDAPQKSQELLSSINAFAQEIKREGIRYVVLLGMGGSSLAPEVFQEVIGRQSDAPLLITLDSTDARRIQDVQAQIDLKKTLFIFASKSGTTIEPAALFAYFFDLVQRQTENPGHSFVAITDPDTFLNKMAREKKFRKIFLADPNVGGRFSALTPFGLVPAALVGINVNEVLKRVQKYARDSRSKDESALVLGVAMATCLTSGRDKLTLMTSPAYRAFGDWVEQLVAESTGKCDKGVAPIIREHASVATGQDRFYVVLESQLGLSEDDQARLKTIQAEGHPHMEISFKEPLDLGVEFLRWELATAVAGVLIEINPFDQPNVQEAKDQAKALLKQLEAGQGLSFDTQPFEFGSRAVASKVCADKSIQKAWQNFGRSLKPQDAFNILAFLPDRPEVRKSLEAIKKSVCLKTGCAVSLGFGPRYLHSTGQLHKGGPDRALYLVLSAPEKSRLKVPGKKYSFEELEYAQAVGDFQALNAKGRRAFYVELPDLKGPTLALLEQNLLKSFA